MNNNKNDKNVKGTNISGTGDDSVKKSWDNPMKSVTAPQMPTVKKTFSVENPPKATKGNRGS